MFYPFIKISMKPFCQTLYKTAPAPLEKPLHQRSRSWSCFWWSRSPAKQALSWSLGGLCTELSRLQEKLGNEKFKIYKTYIIVQHYKILISISLKPQQVTLST